MADLVLPRGKWKVLQADDKDYKRGLLVKLLEDGGYKMAYWYNKPNKPMPVEIIVDGESITKDGKVVEMKFHPKDYYDKQEESTMKLEELVGKPITEAQFDEAAGKKDACYHKVKARYDVWPSAYASGALVKCRKVGAKNWGNKSKKEGLDDLKALPKDLKKSIKKNREESVNEAGMEMNKLKDAIKMFQKKIDKQGSVTNARDEEHLKNLIKVYKQMGGKGIKESISEGKYHQYRNDETMTPKQKIGRSMREIRDSLNELDKLVKMNVRLKNELNVDSRSYWKNTHKALGKISERLVKLANKVGQLK